MKSDKSLKTRLTLELDSVMPLGEGAFRDCHWGAQRNILIAMWLQSMLDLWIAGYSTALAFSYQLRKRHLSAISHLKLGGNMDSREFRSSPAMRIVGAGIPQPTEFHVPTTSCSKMHNHGAILTPCCPPRRLFESLGFDLYPPQNMGLAHDPTRKLLTNPLRIHCIIARH
jgi:hypothetical protein